MAVTVAFLGLVSSATAQPQPPLAAPTSDLSSITAGTMLAALGTVSLSIAHAVLSFFQWRVARNDKDDKAELVKANILTLAELEDARNDLKARDAAIVEMKAEIATKEERYRAEETDWRQERDILVVKLAQAKGSNDDISTILVKAPQTTNVPQPKRESGGHN